MSFETRLLISRVALVAAAGVFALCLIIWRKQVREILRAFFSAATSPTNLAIYRIVFFAAVLVDFGHDYDPATINFYASLPHALQTPPEPMGIWSRILPHVPISPSLAHQATLGLTVFSFLAMIGFFTRTSAWLVVALAVYVLGIPQYYGKVNHTHHLLWFGAILAASRCGDALSVDAILAAFRRAGRTKTDEGLAPPAPSRAYALPLRFVWILIGLIYFFPGFHKWWTGGVDWAFSDNFRNRMWEAWYQRDVFADSAWRPIMRLDEYPLLFKLSALGAIGFELTWVFLILTRRLRSAAVAVALSFHVGTYFLMKIQFWSLVLNFVTFVDWDYWLRKIGRGAFEVEYDGTSLGDRRRVAVLRSLDVIVASQFRDAGPAARHAWGSAILRTPLAWPIAPLLMLIPSGGAPTGTDAGRSTPGFPRFAAITFGVLLVGNCLFGLKGARDGWPLTCYPTFARVIEAEIPQTDVVVSDAAGAPIDWDHLEMKNRFSKSRYSALMALLGKEKDAKKLRAFWQVLAKENPKFAEAHHVEFFAVVYSTEPSPTHKELSRKKVWELDLQSQPGGGNASHIGTAEVLLQ